MLAVKGIRTHSRFRILLNVTGFHTWQKYSRCVKTISLYKISMCSWSQVAKVRRTHPIIFLTSLTDSSMYLVNLPSQGITVSRSLTSSTAYRRECGKIADTEGFRWHYNEDPVIYRHLSLCHLTKPNYIFRVSLNWSWAMSLFPLMSLITVVLSAKL